MNNYAPVLIITLNRYEHFMQCVESLSACTHADKTDLYIAFDYPLKDSHWDGYKKIENYIEKIHGFRKVNIIKRNINYGATKNLFDGMAEVFEKNDRIILSEDDNVFAPSFLKVVNTGLNTYKSRQDIFSISAYNSPLPMPSWYKHNVYLITGFTAWGVGVWKDKWNKIDWSLDSFNAMLSKKENYKILIKYYQRYLPQLLEIRDTGVITVDGFIFLYLLDKKMYSVYTAKSRVRNMGHDGSGEHCGQSEIYANQKIYEGFDNVYFPSDLHPDKKLIDLISKHIQLPFIQRIKGLIPAPIRMTLRRICKK